MGAYTPEELDGLSLVNWCLPKTPLTKGKYRKARRHGLTVIPVYSQVVAVLVVEANANITSEVM
jgi:hypothetical protein